MQARGEVHHQRRVLGRGRRAAATWISSARSSRRSSTPGDHGQHPRHGGLRHPGEFGEMIATLMARVPNIDKAVVSVALPQRPGAGRGQLPGGGAGRGPAGGVHHQRHRRAGGQRLAGRGRHGAPGAADDLSPSETGIATEEIYPTSRLVSHVTGLAGAGEQGDRGRQRLRPRGGHPPGRRAQGEAHLRDHDAESVGVPRTNWCWASTRAAMPSGPREDDGLRAGRGPDWRRPSRPSRSWRTRRRRSSTRTSRP